MIVGVFKDKKKWAETHFSSEKVVRETTEEAFWCQDVRDAGFEPATSCV
jgi:hypothetical protein